MISLHVRRQFFRYVLVGILNFLIGAAVLNLLARVSNTYSGPLLLVFSAIAVTLSITTSYICNRHWTFNAARDTPSRYPLFYAVTLIGFGLGSLVLFVMTTYLRSPRNLSAPVWLNLANIMAAGCGLLWNFFAYRYVVFRSAALEGSN